MTTSDLEPPLQRPRISVILPTHDRRELLAEAVDSVARQTYLDWELLVIDDASSPPATLGNLSVAHGAWHVIKHEQPLGGSAAKNTGARAARGEILAFLDDDDLYDAAYLETAIRILDTHPEIEVLFMGVAWFGRSAEWGEKSYAEAMRRTLAEAKGKMLETELIVFDEGLVGALLNRVPMAFQRPVVRREAFDRIGAYRPDCLLWDCEWALRAAMSARCGLSVAPLYRQRSDGQGYSSRADKQLAQAESAVDMILRLLEHKSQQRSTHCTGLLRTAAARNAGHLAYFHAQQGRISPAVSAWWLSQRLRPSLASWRIPISAIMRAFGWRRQG